MRLTQKTSKKMKAVAAVASLVAVGALSACGSDSSPTGAAGAVTAMGETFNASELSATVTLDVSDEVVNSMFEKKDERALAKKLLQSEVTMASRSADGSKLGRGSTDLSTLTKTDSTFVVKLAGDNIIDLRIVEGAMYAAVGVQTIAKLAGEDPAELNGLADSYGPELQDLLDGKFVSLSKGAVSDLLKVMESETEDTADAEALYKLLAEPAQAVLTGSASAKQLDGDTTRLRVDVRSLVTNYVDALNTPATISQIAKLTDEDSSVIKKDLDNFKADLPKDVKDLTFDVTIKDGKVTELTIDLLQFASWSDRTKAKFVGGHARLDISFSQKTDIAAPKSHTNMDKLLNGVIGGESLPGSASSGAVGDSY